jgi:hypothetical protein
MTPQEQFDYKLTWKPGHIVRLHSDLDTEGKTWCKRNLERHQWSFTTWTASYEHTFHFESEYVSQQFVHEFGKYANQ